MNVLLGAWLALALGSPSLRRTPVVEVVERSGPAVVNISAAERSPFRRGGRTEAWERFFGRRRRRPAPQEPQALGSGVMVRAQDFLPGAEGTLVLTNEHVVAGAGDVTVGLSDRRSLRAELLAADPNFDIAVLRVRDTSPLPTVDLGGSHDLMIGETVVAIGNPFGLASTVTTGVVSALHRVIEVGDRIYEDFVQTDAAINPGNSGGALLNIEGKLIGINTAIYSEGHGIGFAIPVDKVRAIVQEVLQFGEVRPAYTGIVVAVPGSGPGALILSVLAGSPAEKVGLQPGDRVVDIGGQEVRDGRDFRRIERALVPGRDRSLQVVRGGAKMSAVLPVRELDVSEAAAIGLRRLGLALKEDPQRRVVVITGVADGSSAGRSGIRPGDFLLGLAGRRIQRQAELIALLAAIYDADRVSTLVGRGGRAYVLTLELSP